MTRNDALKILGSPTTRDELKAAYRKAAMIHHPDKGGDPAKFAEVNSAYHYLLVHGLVAARMTETELFGTVFAKPKKSGVKSDSRSSLRTSKPKPPQERVGRYGINEINETDFLKGYKK